MVGYDFSDLTTSSPEKSLTKHIWRTAGRNNTGRITMRFMGWWHKRLYRMIDFKGYDKIGVPAKVASIEYDPYRTARIALLHYADGEKRYVLAWKGISVGDAVMNWPDAIIQAGNRKQLKDIPEGVQVYNIEFTPFTKGKLIKSAGLFATIDGKDDILKLTFIKLPSGEVRRFHDTCWATIGQIGNEDHKNIVIGKAGRQRWLGKKPKVLGINMNPVDHPHGWGEAHSDIGLKRGPKSFSGRVVSPGIKTRKKSKWSTKFIVSRRNKKK